MITLDAPFVHVDGQQVDLWGLEHSAFIRMKAALRDENVYDNSESAVPFTTRLVTFTGTAVSGAQSLIAYNETKDGKLKVKTFAANADGTFEFSVRLRNGKNKISVESATGKHSSNAMQLNSYKLDTWLYAYAEEAATIRNYTAQLRQDRKLQDGVDFDGNPITNTGQGLTDHFGPFIDPLVRLEGQSVTGWREGIRDVFAAYQVAPSVQAMNLVVRFFTGLDAEFKFYKDENRLRKPLFVDSNYFLASAANPGVDTSFQWQSRRVYFRNRWWQAQGDTITLATGARTWIYYTGTNLITGSTATGSVPIDYHMLHTTSVTEPAVTGSWPFSERISANEIAWDQYGNYTGLSGELFVRPSMPIASLNGVSGTSSMTTGIAEAVLVPGNSYIDLGHAQLGQDKPTVFGDLILDYQVPSDIYEVAVVDTSSTTVTGMFTGGNRFDEASGIIRQTEVAQHAGEMLIWESQTLASGTRHVLTGTLLDAKMPGTFFYVFMEDPSSGQMTYYAKV